MAAINNIIFKNYAEADKYRKHLSIEEKAKLYDLICNILPYEDEAYKEVWKKYGDKWSDKHSERFAANRIHAFYQLMAILDAGIKPALDEISYYDENGEAKKATQYRTVDVDLTLDKLCKFLSDLFGMEFIWGRDVLAERGREVEHFIRVNDDSKLTFLRYGDEFTPLYDDWWGLLNHYIPTYLLNEDNIKLWNGGTTKNTKPNTLKGIKNAKELLDKLIELGY